MVPTDPAVFRHLTQAALDREYNNSEKVRNSRSLIQSYTTMSNKARDTLNAELNVPYGLSGAEKLDIFSPGSSGDKGRPIHVFLHGGYWRAMSKNEFSYVSLGLDPAGFITIVIDYALIPKVTMSEQVAQCRRALVWIYANAASFGGDSARISISGHSAGGHLVAMMMTTDWGRVTGVCGASKITESPIQSACAISGLFDLTPIRLSFLNQELNLTEVEVSELSPVRCQRTSRAPLQLVAGGLEGEEYHRQSRDLEAIWCQPATDPELLILDNEDHFSIAASLADTNASLTRLIIDQAKS